MFKHGFSVSSRAPLVAAFAAVYLIWGSTYLGIRVAVETLPPFLLASTRFLLAGSLLYGWAALRNTPRPSRRAWTAATVIGALLLAGGNGGVTWAEQRVPSGLAALLVATEPLWIGLLDWLRPGGVRPTMHATVGIALGFAGVVLLVNPAGDVVAGGVDLVGATVIILAALSWAAGSLYARRAPLPASGVQAAGMQMLAGGGLLLVVSLGAGEVGAFAVRQVSLRSMVAFGYLVIFGSLVAFSAYGWLVQHTTPTRAATHAYVNPLVAVLLGWVFAGETITGRTLIATMAIVSAVALITVARHVPDRRRPTPEQAPDDGTAPSAALRQPSEERSRAWTRRDDPVPDTRPLEER